MMRSWNRFLMPCYLNALSQKKSVDLTSVDHFSIIYGGGSLIRLNVSRAGQEFSNVRIDAGFSILALWNSLHSHRYLMLLSIPRRNSQSLEKCSSSNGDMGCSSFARAAAVSSSSSFSPSRSSFSLSFSSASHRHCSVVSLMSWKSCASLRSFSSSRCCVKQSVIFDGEMTALG